MTRNESFLLGMLNTRPQLLNDDDPTLMALVAQNLATSVKAATPEMVWAEITERGRAAWWHPVQSSDVVLLATGDREWTCPKCGRTWSTDKARDGYGCEDVNCPH